MPAFAMISLGVPAGHEIAAVDACARADVDDAVGRKHGVPVVLDDHDRVAEVSQGKERVEELAVVARVKADARLVEDIDDAGEPRADLRGEPDALRLAARQRG